MKIALCSIGSRGDIQPFLILGEYFSKHGHEVKVVSAKMYQSAAENYKVDYEYFEGDYEALANDEELKKMIGKNPFTMGKVLKEKVYPILESSMHKYYEAAQWADVVIYHPKTMIDTFANAFQKKLVKAYVVPAFTPTSEFRNPLLDFLPFPKFLNKFTYKLSNAMIGNLKTPIKNVRKKIGITQKKSFLDTPIIYGISPSFLKRPSDYPAEHFFTGFWLPPIDTSKSLSPEIENFLLRDKKTLIITFGSMPYKSKIDFNLFVKAILEKFDIQILVVKAWGLKEYDVLENPNVLAIDRAPFDILFPKADFVIHHGGGGTTATALKAGIPQMICPILHPVGDQNFWGKQIQKKGLGIKPIPLEKLTIKKLVQSVEDLMNGNFEKNTTLMSQQIKEEDGLAEALRIIENHFKSNLV